MAPTTQDTALALQSEFQSAIADIRADQNLSMEGRQALMVPLYKSAKAKLDTLRAQEGTSANQHQAFLEREIFGTIGTSNPSAAISYRDAQDRASALPGDFSGQAEAVRLLEQAQRSGDTELAKAIALRAFDLGWVPVLNAFADANPGTGPKIQELYDIHQEVAGSRGLTNRLTTSMTYSLDKPSEIASLNDYTGRLPGDG